MVPSSVGLLVGLIVLRYRLYAIDRLINRTLAYGSLAGVYAALVLVLGQLFGGSAASHRPG